MDCQLFFRVMAFAVCVLGNASCVTVRPEEKELLADPAMVYGASGELEAQEEHVLANREGAAGAGRTSGGGCGCN